MSDSHSVQFIRDTAAAPAPASPMDADMAHVVETLVSLGARPLEHVTPEQARRQPGWADAIQAIVARQGRQPPEDGVEVEDIGIPSGDDELMARIYRPVGLLSRLNPVVLYFGGGGFVAGTLDTRDASARAIARRSGAVVISVAYRLAPEHRFPQAHEDAWTAWKWMAAQAHRLGVDTRRVALCGEDAGANLALNTALRARDEHYLRPVHLVLIHPMAGIDLSTASYREAARLRPIGLSAMRWRLRHLIENESALDDPRLNLVARDNLAGLAPVTLVLAGLDPLRSEGEMLGELLEGAHVPVSTHFYEGMVQGFFGLGLVVTKALFAQAEVAEALAHAFGPGRRAQG